MYPTPSSTKDVGEWKGSSENPRVWIPAYLLRACLYVTRSILNIRVHKFSAVQELKSFKDRDLNHHFVPQTLSLNAKVLLDPVSSCTRVHHGAHLLTLSSSRAGMVGSLVIPSAEKLYKANQCYVRDWMDERCVRMKGTLDAKPCLRSLNSLSPGTRPYKRQEALPVMLMCMVSKSLCEPTGLGLVLWSHLHSCNIFKVQIWYHFTRVLIRSYFESSFLFIEQCFKIPFNVFISRIQHLEGGGEVAKILTLDSAYHYKFCEWSFDYI